MRRSATILLLGLTLAACEPELPAPEGPNAGSEAQEATYRNPLTGAVRFAPWSEPSAGLRCRLGAARTTHRRGSRPPVIVLQVENVSDDPIPALGVFGGNMLVNDCPTEATYTNRLFDWVFDGARLREPLQPGDRVEAACRLPWTVMREVGPFELKMTIALGVGPPSQGPLFDPGDDRWSGSMTTPPLAMVATP